MSSQETSKQQPKPPSSTEPSVEPSASSVTSQQRPSARTTQKRTPTCAWCGRDIEFSGRGRPKQYCGQSCRQRAYEQRNNVKGTPIPKNAVILTPERADLLRDNLFELRCAAEDIATAIEDNEDPRDVATLCAELIDLAKNIEQFRVRD